MQMYNIVIKLSHRKMAGLQTMSVLCWRDELPLMWTSVFCNSADAQTAILHTQGKVQSNKHLKICNEDQANHNSICKLMQKKKTNPVIPNKWKRLYVFALKLLLHHSDASINALLYWPISKLLLWAFFYLFFCMLGVSIVDWSCKSWNRQSPFASSRFDRPPHAILTDFR